MRASSRTAQNAKTNGLPVDSTPEMRQIVDVVAAVSRNLQGGITDEKGGVVVLEHCRQLRVMGVRIRGPPKNRANNTCKRPKSGTTCRSPQVCTY